jgi:TRAP transporter TAXI family solute receptor
MLDSRILSAAGAALGLALLTAPAAHAQGGKLPETITFTAYETGTSGFNITVAVGKMLKEKYNSEARVLPAGNDVARIGPLKAGRAQLSAMGIGMYFAQEGVFEFAAKDWGPQALQQLIHSNDCNALALSVAKDTGVKEIKDLRGKRVAVVVGSPALTQNAIAMLAFGGLTPQDVKLVEFASNAAMFKGILNNDADAAATSTINPLTREVESSPRGLIWPPMPHNDEAGWTRMRKLGPFFSKHTATCGSGGISAQNPLQLAGYPYPIYMVYASQPADVAYELTKAMIEGYDLYKDGAPGAAGLSLKSQKFQWAVPFHPGAVKAFKDVKAWTDADEAYNNGLLKRQQVLAAGWEAFTKTNPPADAEAHRKAWMAARKEALAKAGLDPVFE